MGSYSAFWRCANLAMATFFLLAASVQLNDDDWWLWVPIYGVPCILTTAIVLNPKVVDNHLWRLFCACTIVFDLIHLLYLFWVVSDILSYGFVRNPLEFEEGRECAGLAIVVIWTIICRMTATNLASIVRHVRLLIFGAILLSCLPLLAWSACFFETGYNSVPYCKNMFITGDNDM